MKTLNFEQMEIISAGALSQNQTCLIGGFAAFVGCCCGEWGFAVAMVAGGLYYGCF